ncbi:hypothetical protein FRB90_010894, partial [Tulasnella sp. 427]
MAPRGLSAEEKRVKLLEIFHESVFNFPWTYSKAPRTNLNLQKDFYQLKELEKLGPKLKGI